MEADDFRPRRLDRGARRLAEWWMSGRKRQSRNVGAKLHVIRRDTRKPSRVGCAVLDGLRMAEEIEVERLRAARPERGNALVNLIWLQRRAWQRAEPACSRHADGELHAGVNRHRRGHDRQ